MQNGFQNIKRNLNQESTEIQMGMSCTTLFVSADITLLLISISMINSYPFPNVLKLIFKHQKEQRKTIDYAQKLKKLQLLNITET